MWPLVLSQGRSVPLPVRSISRTRRSPQARNRLRPLARLIPAGSPHRSMSASTTRPVQHSAPLLLSIFARPHQDGLMRSWRADSLCLRMARFGITPCCKSLFVLGTKNSPGSGRDFHVKMWGTSSPDDKLTGDLGNVIEATQICGRRSDRLMARKLSSSNFGLLQQYRHKADKSKRLPFVRFRSEADIDRAARASIGGPTILAALQGGRGPRRPQRPPLSVITTCHPAIDFSVMP